MSWWRTGVSVTIKNVGEREESDSMNKNIKFIYFDIGGVLMRWQGMMEAVAIKYGRTQTEVEEAYFRYDDLACRGDLTTENAWKMVCRDLQILPSSSVNFVTFCLETFTPIIPTHRLAKSVIKQYPLGLLTNIHKGGVELFIEKHLIPDLPYAAVIKSCDVGHIKPEKAIYDIAKKEAGVDHKHILFADDLLQNIEAARSLGWQAIQFLTDQPEQSVREIRKMLGLK